MKRRDCIGQLIGLNVMAMGLPPISAFAANTQTLAAAPKWRARRWVSEQSPAQMEWVDQSSLERNWAYIDFWASWCVPCRLSFPFMNELNAKFVKGGLKLFAISVDKDLQSISGFIRQNPAQFSILWDPEGTAAQSFQVPAMPTSFLINPQGVIVMRHAGFRLSDRETLMSTVTRAIEAR